MSGSKPGSALGPPPRPARFDFPPIKVDQYGLPDQLMAAIKGSVAFGSQQLESPAMQVDLDLHALATLRNAMKMGERALYLGDSAQRPGPKSAASAADREVERLLALLPQAEPRALGAEGDEAQLLSPRASRTPGAASEASPATHTPRSHQHLLGSMSDSGQQPSPTLQQRATNLADLAAAAAAERGLSSSPAAGVGQAQASARTWRPNVADTLFESENAQISRHTQRVMEARGLQPRFSAPSPTDSPSAPLSAPGTTQKLPPAPWSPAAGQRAVGMSPARPAHTSGPPSRASPTKMTLRPRMQLGYNSGSELLAAAAVETGAGLHACLPPVMLKHTQRLMGSPRVSAPGAVPGAHSASGDDVRPASPRFMPTAFGQHQPHLQSTTAVSESGSGHPESLPATPVNTSARRARRASYSIPGQQQPLVALGPKRSVDDAEALRAASASPHLPQLPSSGSWNTAAASAVGSTSMRQMGKQTTRNWRM